MVARLRELRKNYISLIDYEMRSEFEERLLSRPLINQINSQINEVAQRLYCDVTEEIATRHREILDIRINDVSEIKGDHQAHLATILVVGNLFERGIFSIQ